MEFFVSVVVSVKKKRDNPDIVIGRLLKTGWGSIGRGCFLRNAQHQIPHSRFIFSESDVDMASKEVDISREGKDLRLVITVSDVSTSRLSRAFQVSPSQY